MSQEPVKIAITLNGGIVQNILTAGVPIEAVIIDYDTDGATEDQGATPIPQLLDFNEQPTDATAYAFVNRCDAEHDPIWSPWVLDRFTEPAPEPEEQPPLKLWLLSQNEQHGYDTYDSCVVAAVDEQSARQTCPSGFYIWRRNGWKRSNDPDGPIVLMHDWANSLENITVTLLGDAQEGIEPGVVCASFNAG